MQVHGVGNELQGSAVDTDDFGTKCVVSPYDFIESPFKNIGVQETDKIPSKRAVKGRIARPQTIGLPHPHLRSRKWKCIELNFTVARRHY